VVLAGGLAYANSFGGVFLLDDYGHIVTSETIRNIRPLTKHLWEDRPVVHLSLAVNYAISGLEPWSYHAVNLGVHLLAGLALLGVARRAMSLRGPPGEARRAALALVIALLWVLHPLQTQSVTYIIQRGESLMGLLYLLTLYGFLRAEGAGGSATAAGRRGWRAAMVAACAAGMLSKEVMVTAPLMVWLFDGFFVAGGWREPLRRRWGMYLLLAGTWGLLAAQGLFTDLVFGSKEHAADIGFRVEGITPLQYLRTQPEILLHYLRQCVWPARLCFDYGWPPVGSWTAAAAPGVVVVGILAATVWLSARRRVEGLLGAWWFLILVPTSSFLPIKDLAFEQRVYLPLAAVLAGVVLAVESAARRRVAAGGWRAGTAEVVLIVLAGGAAVALGARTARRNADYASAVAMWADVTSQRPGHARGHLYHGVALAMEGRLEEAAAAYRRAIAIAPDFAEAEANLGKALAKLGRHAEAVSHYQRALRGTEEDPDVRHSLAISLERAGRGAEAIEEYRRVIASRPDHPLAHFNLGLALKHMGRWEEALAAFGEALRVAPGDAEACYERGLVLARAGRPGEAAAEFEAALRLRPGYAEARQALSAVRRPGS
jgi:tetratricopeptide (TPR) repeat protein